MTIHSVTNQSELGAAIAAAAAGDTVRLAPGTYSSLNVNNKQWASTVTFISSDTNNRAEITEMRAQNTTHARFEELVFTNSSIGGVAAVCYIELGSNFIDVVNCESRGVPNANGSRKAVAYRLNGNPSNVTFDGCTIRDFKNGITSSNATNLHIYNSEFHGLGSDGGTLTRQVDLHVKGNYFHDNNRSLAGEHADCLQIARSSGYGSTNCIIEENVIDAGDGAYGQGFFGGSSGQSSNSTTRHSNITYRNNLLYVAHVHALELLWCDGVLCENNTVLFVEATTPYPFKNRPTITFGGSTSVTIGSNIVSAISHSNGGEYTLTNNILINDGPGYAAAFNILAKTNAPYATGDVYHDFEIKAGSAAHTALAGSRMQKREGGWPGNTGIAPHPAYPGGYIGGQSGSAPVVSSFDPADDAADVMTSKIPSVTFDKAIQLGSSKSVTIRENNGGWSDWEVLDTTADAGTGAGTLEVSGSRLIVNPSQPFVGGREYAFHIEAGAVQDTDASPKDFAGISDDTTWSFTAVSSVPAMPVNGQLTMEITVA